MLIKWIGQAGFELKSNDVSVLIDPYLSDSVLALDGFNRLVPPPILPVEVHAGYIISTHDHVDHLDPDMVTAMNLDGVLFAGPDTCCRHWLELGVPENQIIPLNRGGKLCAGDIEFSAVYAEHTEDSIGVVMEYSGKRYYFVGDSLLTDKVGENIKADVIIVCINGKLGNMNAVEAAELTKRVKAKTGVPTHYGMFAENTQDPAAYTALLESTGINTVVLTHDTVYDLSIFDA